MTDNLEGMLLRNNCIYTLNYTVDSVLVTNYLLAKANCQGHFAKVKLSISAPHTHIFKKLRILIIHINYQNDILGRHYWTPCLDDYLCYDPA
jgi:hypothetical protein